MCKLPPNSHHLMHATSVHFQEDGISVSVQVSSNCAPGATCGGLCTPVMLSLGSCMPGVYRLQYIAIDSGGLSDMASVDVHIDELQSHTLSFVVACRDLTACKPTYEASASWALSLQMTPNLQWDLARCGHACWV